jgi:hypothetical protein
MLNNTGSSENCRVECVRPVGAKEYGKPPSEAADTVDSLNQCVHRHLVLMMTLSLISRRGKRIAFIHNQEGHFPFPDLFLHNLECLVDKRAHLANVPRPPDASAQLEKETLATKLFRQSTAGDLCSFSLACSYITGEDCERISICNKVLDLGVVSVMALSPSFHTIRIHEESERAPQAIESSFESDKALALGFQPSVWKHQLKLKKRTRFSDVHDSSGPLLRVGGSFEPVGIARVVAIHIT